MVSFCLANDVSEYEDLDPLRWVAIRTGLPCNRIHGADRTIDFRTDNTVAGEFSAGAGCTDFPPARKADVPPPLLAPVVVILDPAICPRPVALVVDRARAIDHVVNLCSINLQPYVEGRHAMRFGYWQTDYQIEANRTTSTPG